MVSFKQKSTSDASSDISTPDSIEEIKMEILKDKERSGLQFSISVSSLVHKVESGCSGITFIVHNPTKRQIAFLTNHYHFEGHPNWPDKSTLYQGSRGQHRRKRSQVREYLQLPDIGLGMDGFVGMVEFVQRLEAATTAMVPASR